MNLNNNSINVTDEDRLRQRVVRKAFIRLIPFMFILYVISYLDRINVGFAALQMNEHLGFDPAVFGLGGGIFFIGYFLFEVPSNLIMERVGARFWIARIMITWGLISSSMMFVHDVKSFYLLRFLLGLAEAGFFPGMVLYLTYWFPPSVRAQAIALFMTATAASGVIGGPASGALLEMHGLWSLHGWQWLFLIEGLPAVVLGIAVIFYLPDGPEKASWLTEAEKNVIARSIEAERQQVQTSGEKESLRHAFSDPRVWMLSAMYMAIVIALYSISLWLPLIVKAFTSFDAFMVGIVTTIPYITAIIVMITVGVVSDKSGKRKPYIIASLAVASVGFAVSAFTHSPIVELIALATAAGGTWGAFGPFWSLPPLFLSGKAKAGGIAIINSVGNLGGFLGPYLVGIIKKQTNSFSYALLSISGILIMGIILTAFFKAKSGDPLKRTT